MKQVLLYDPAIGSINLGDAIISASARTALAPLLSDAFVMRMSTHTPAGRFYLRHFVRSVDLRFVLGSNLLMGHLNGRFRQWDINWLNAPHVGPVVLMGVGWWQAGQTWNRYTRSVYRRVLSDVYLHSVRDALTESRMREMGFENVINTGCPTTWGLTPSHCAAVPAGRSAEVVTTLTDYMPDPRRDRHLLQTLKRRYERVHIWLQGAGDAAYLAELGESEQTVGIIPPTLEAYDAMLSGTRNIEFIGTRLHGGIRAIQHSRRALVIGIDSRAREMQADIGLPVLEAEAIEMLEAAIDSVRPLDIRLPQAGIDRFLAQFIPAQETEQEGLS